MNTHHNAKTPNHSTRSPACITTQTHTHSDTLAQTPSDLLKLCEEVVDHVFDLRGLGREQDQLLVGQVELQHVLRRNRHEQDVRVAYRK